jgi:hypothetical protein
MATFQGLDDFRSALESAGWAIANNNIAAEYNGCNWYAWNRQRVDGPDCECNDKPPALIVYPHVFSAEFMRRHDVSHANAGSVEVEVCGERGGQWLKFRVYSITPAEFFERLPLASRQLAAAWRAAAGVV